MQKLYGGLRTNLGYINSSLIGKLEGEKNSLYFFISCCKPHRFLPAFRISWLGSSIMLYCIRVITLHSVGCDTQKWQDILKEVKFLKDTKHENCIHYKGGYLKDTNCWVSTPSQ